jgi:putative methyltransferase (TIGR04325 family)
LLPEVTLDYTVKEHLRLCDVGHGLMPDVKFVPSDDECFERRYDVVIASSSLQYAENWRQVAQRLAHSANEWLLVTSLPVVRESPGFVISHRAHRYGLRTEYLAWVLNARDLITSISDEGFELEREFLLGELRVPRVREDISFGGFLFRRTEQPLTPKVHS